MTIPKTSEQLTAAIEAIIGSYLAELRCTTQQAVERALSSSSRYIRTAPRKVKRRYVQPAAAKRRSAAELGALCDRLHAAVCARPGESILALAEEMGVKWPELQKPMSKLRTQGRVRTVGERNMTRYFPAVARATKVAVG
jgi:hypothetical protein